MNKRKRLLILIDLCIILAINAIACWMFPEINSILFVEDGMIYRILVIAFITLTIRYICGIYSSVWRYANVTSYSKLIISDAISGALFVILSLIIPPLNPGFSYVLVCAMATVLTTLVSRFCYQVLFARITQSNDEKSEDIPKHKIYIAIIGAGKFGTSLADELLNNPRSHYYPYCFIDNNKSKVGNTIRGIKIYDEDNTIVERIKNMPVKEIVIALPDATQEQKMEIYERYKETNCKIKIYDYPLENESIASDRMSLREIKIEDLLFRDSIVLDKRSNKVFYSGKTILVTGGGGSIGSELCRQIAKCKPKQLIIVDIYENNAYEIQQHLIRNYGANLNLKVIIASVRDYETMDKIFATYRPDIVFHAAAHKHVPLMEDAPAEAVKNNVFGTYNVANAAEKYGVKKFILISTDKAVNPTNIMGASKRLCEMLVQSRTNSKTEFAAVRFGNVLGSNGSVIPLFRKQIAAGGPVTITDKRIIRYFMTIPEAVSLVMETGNMAKGGELFVLDMGKPVKILDLAEKMVQLSGFVPYQDIDIVEIGLRPGEKLYEELLMKNEDLDKTSNNMIFIERDRTLTREEIEDKLLDLRDAVNSQDNERVISVVKRSVPTFREPSELNKNAEQSDEMKATK